MARPAATVSIRRARCCGRPSAADWSSRGPACAASSRWRRRWRCPRRFPFRDLIVLTAFSVVLGTLVIQGLTLKPLLRALNLQDDDPVGRELACGA